MQARPGGEMQVADCAFGDIACMARADMFGKCDVILDEIGFYVHRAFPGQCNAAP